MHSASRIFVINLDRRADRLELISERLNRMGLAWERISATEGDDPSLSSRVDWAKYRYYNQLLPLKNGPIGCYFSHRSVWQRMVDEGIEQALILEDDVAPTADWDAEILNTRIANLGLDQLRLDQSWHRGPMRWSTYFEIPLGRWTARNINTWGAGAYFMTREGAAKCLKLEKMWFVADDFFMMNRVLGIKTAALTPSLWWHPEETPSDVAMPKAYYYGTGFFPKMFSLMVTAFLRERERWRLRRAPSS